MTDELFENKEAVKETALPAVKPATMPVPGDLSKDDWLMMRILENGQMDAFKQFIELRRVEKERGAKEAYDEHFAAMQSKYVPVARTKEVWDKAGTKVLYKFCPLEDILKVYAPIIAEHGFSYRWSEEAINEGKDKRIYCIVSGWGHEERGYVDIPIMDGNAFTNAVQQRGVSTSYGKRYSFINAFGIIIEDEDDENSFEAETVIAVADGIKKIKDSKTMAELAANFSATYKEVEIKDIDDNEKQKQLGLLIKAKDEMKKILK